MGGGLGEQAFSATSHFKVKPQTFRTRPSSGILLMQRLRHGECVESGGGLTTRIGQHTIPLFPAPRKV